MSLLVGEQEISRQAQPFLYFAFFLALPVSPSTHENDDDEFDEGDVAVAVDELVVRISLQLRFTNKKNTFHVSSCYVTSPPAAAAVLIFCDGFLRNPSSLAERKNQCPQFPLSLSLSPSRQSATATTGCTSVLNEVS